VFERDCRPPPPLVSSAYWATAGRKASTYRVQCDRQSQHAPGPRVNDAAQQVALIHSFRCLRALKPHHYTNTSNRGVRMIPPVQSLVKYDNPASINTKSPTKGAKGASKKVWTQNQGCKSHMEPLLTCSTAPRRGLCRQ